jgi:disulfide bond formation protein DsbB
MDVEQVQVFTAVLALAAATLAGAVVVGRLLRGRVRWLDEVMTAIDDAALWLAWLVAAVATAGSLYFSESAHFTPCRLCWFQRCAMYPLAVILLVAAIRRDRGIRWYAVPVAAIGAAISIYHYVLEWNPSLEGGACELTGPACSFVWFREFGFVTLPFMALCGFVTVIVLLVATRRPPTEETT